MKSTALPPSGTHIRLRSVPNWHDSELAAMATGRPTGLSVEVNLVAWRHLATHNAAALQVRAAGLSQ